MTDETPTHRGARERAGAEAAQAAALRRATACSSASPAGSVATSASIR